MKNNIIWIGYGSLKKEYRHPGRCTNQILENLSRKYSVIFFEGVIKAYNPTKMSESLKIYKGLCPWSKELTLIHKVFVKYFLNYLNRIFIAIKILSCKPQAVIVDHNENYYILTLCNYFNIPVIVRIYGVWDISEKLSLQRKYRKLLNLECVKKIILTQDGSDLNKLTDTIENKKKIFKLKNAIIAQPLGEVQKNSTFKILIISTFSEGKGARKIKEILMNIDRKLDEKIEVNCIGNIESNMHIEELKNIDLIFHGVKDQNAINNFRIKSPLAISLNSNNPISEALTMGQIVVSNNFDKIEEVYKGIKGLKLVGKPSKLPNIDSLDTAEFANTVIKLIFYLKKLNLKEYGDLKKEILNSLSREFKDIQSRTEEEVRLIES